MRRLFLVLTLLSCFPVASCAADKAVNAVAAAIETSYGLKHTHLPWIARATMKPFLVGSGVSMNFSLFEDQPLPASVSLDDLQSLTEKALGPRWSPFVRSESRRDGERTLIYVSFEGKRMLMLIVAAERDETTVLKMKLNTATAIAKLVQPDRVAQGKSKSKSGGVN